MLTIIRIQQNYDKLDGHWFPIQINTDLDFRNYKFAGRHMMAQQPKLLQRNKNKSAIKKIFLWRYHYGTYFTKAL